MAIATFAIHHEPPFIHIETCPAWGKDACGHTEEVPHARHTFPAHRLQPHTNEDGSTALRQPAEPDPADDAAWREQCALEARRLVAAAQPVEPITDTSLRGRSEL